MSGVYNVTFPESLHNELSFKKSSLKNAIYENEILCRGNEIIVLC